MLALALEEGFHKIAKDKQLASLKQNQSTVFVNLQERDKESKPFENYAATQAALTGF